MASKKKSGSKKGGKSASASASAANTEKDRKPRKPPLERAIRLAGLLIKSRSSLTKNVKAWTAPSETTGEQRLAITRVVNELKKLEAASDQIAGSLAYLVETKYAPKVEHLGGRAKNFPAGASVALKEKFYDAEIHGSVNAYTVVGETEKGFFRIQAAAKGSPILGVRKGWLEKRENGATTASKGKSADADVGAAVDGDEGDEDENPGLEAGG